MKAYIDKENCLCIRDFTHKSKNEYREYKKHEFCLAMQCPWLKEGECTLKPSCIKSARDFHTWLKENGFRIIKDA